MDTATMDAQKRINRLLDWATRHGAKLHPSVEVYQDAHTGLSFRVKPNAATPVAAHEPIVTLPTSLTLSYINALPKSDKDFAPLPSELLARAKPHVVGRLMLIHEYLKGEASFWWPYIQALPQPADPANWALPPFWPADDAELLDGTNVEVGIEKIKTDVARDIRNVSRLVDDCGDASLQQSFNRTLYHWAYCIFSSRSFRPSLVLSDEETEVLHAGATMDDFSVLLPLFDIGNHDMTTEIQWDLVRNGSASSCELKVGKAFEPGEQVFNNYSMKTNAELLLGYGFMIPATASLHNDYTHVRKRADTPDASEEYLISLRPMTDATSVLARQRKTFDMADDAPMLSAFAHVQPDMVWDIFCTLTSPAQREKLIPVTNPSDPVAAERMRQGVFFAGTVSRECLPYLAQTIAIIQHKVLQELERLSETDVEVVEGDLADLTRNQRLALDYRGRCRRVLESTLESIDTAAVDEMLEG